MTDSAERPSAAAGTPLDLIDPATGEVTRTVQLSTIDDVDSSVAAARTAATEWGQRTPSERARVLLRLADALEAHTEELTALEVAETGKPWTVVADGEIPFAADNLRFFAGAARSTDGTGAGVFSEGYTSMMVRRPVGVVASI